MTASITFSMVSQKCPVATEDGGWARIARYDAGVKHQQTLTRALDPAACTNNQPSPRVQIKYLTTGAKFKSSAEGSVQGLSFATVRGLTHPPLICQIDGIC